MIIEFILILGAISAMGAILILCLLALTLAFI